VIVFDCIVHYHRYYFDDFEMKLYLTIYHDLDEIPTFFIQSNLTISIRTEQLLSMNGYKFIDWRIISTNQNFIISMHKCVH
jgi:hypothetical protein